MSEVDQRLSYLETMHRSNRKDFGEIAETLDRLIKDLLERGAFSDPSDVARLEHIADRFHQLSR